MMDKIVKNVLNEIRSLQNNIESGFGYVDVNQKKYYFEMVGGDIKYLSEIKSDANKPKTNIQS